MGLMARVTRILVCCVQKQDNNQFFLGTSKCCLHMADARSDVCRTWSNDAMVNAVHVSHDGLTITTGDSKVWLMSSWGGGLRT